MPLAYALLVLTLLANAQAGSIINASMTKDTVNQTLVFQSKKDADFYLSFSDVPILSVAPKSDVTLLNISKKNKQLYVLLNVFFTSRSAGALGRCAAGEEHYLVWIELNESYHLSKAEQQIYSSCLYSLEINKPINAYPPMTIDALTNNQPLSVIHAFNNSAIDIRYDITLPENGLRVIKR